ncbi:MAG: hypothetical protein Q7W54_13525, partial [Bacteroidota bacterium]|nr:hypothetical protein [Bacteroidota bacterium]
MKLIPQSPKKAIKPFLKQKPLRSDIDAFKSHLIDLLDKIGTIERRPTDESEEHLKNDLRDFLRDTYYKDINAINTKDKKDLVIHLGKSTDYFDIRKYETILRNNKKEDDRELIALFKILSPQHLLKIATPNDSNSLNDRFYKELLHIIGFEEAKEGSKNIIRRKKEKRNAASFIETIIDAINTEEVLHRLPDQTAYGTTRDERIFNVSLELCITWINRILFLKLLEGQLVTYHQGNKDFCFLNTETIHDFDELFKLFHKVLAVNLNDRTDAIKNKYSRVPYLNSSLFEINELEDQTIKINALDDAGQLELIGTTILKDIKKKADKLPTLDYLFKFLDAYDFASEGTEEVQEDNKTLINASVLGKVFEKINGYKDGSIFTPAFITMYMCKQSIRLAVVEKFNESLTPTLSKEGEKIFDTFE